jgi:hypothetical protein
MRNGGIFLTNLVNQTVYILDAIASIETPRIVLASSYLSIANSSGSINKREFKVSGLAKDFSRLDKPKKMLQFANQYGLLKIKASTPVDLQHDAMYFDNFRYEVLGAVESVNDWAWHVSHIGKLFVLYSAVKNDEPIENIHLYVEGAWVYWDDGQRTLLQHDSKGFREIAWNVLITHIRFFISGAVIVDFGIYKSRVYGKITSTLDTYCEDHKATYVLLAAIYYDLWKTVNSFDSIKFCQCCQKPFTPKKTDQMYCKDACRKRKSRKPKEDNNEHSVPREGS